MKEQTSDRHVLQGDASSGAARVLPSTRKGLATEEAAYAAAVDLFATRGYHGTTLRQIASAIEKQMATLYYYYDSKQSLLQLIMRTAMNDLVSGLERELQACVDADPIEKLQVAVRYHVRFHGTRAKEAFVGDSEIRAVEEDFLPEVLAWRKTYQRMFEALVSEGVDAGIFKAADAAVVAIGILQMCTGVAIWYRPDGRRTLDEIADIYAALVVEGLRARGGSTT